MAIRLSRAPLANTSMPPSTALIARTATSIRFRLPQTRRLRAPLATSERDATTHTPSAPFAALGSTQLEEMGAKNALLVKPTRPIIEVAKSANLELLTQPGVAHATPVRRVSSTMSPEPRAAANAALASSLIKKEAHLAQSAQPPPRSPSSMPIAPVIARLSRVRARASCPIPQRRALWSRTTSARTPRVARHRVRPSA